MELAEAKVKTTASKDMGWQETLVYPVSDVQLGTEACDEQRFKKYIEEGIKRNAYFVGLGDFVDVMSPSNRSRYTQAELYDSPRQLMEDGATAHIERFLRLAKGTEGKWLGLLEGHHYFEYSDGSTSDTRIAKALKAPFLGDCAFLRLKFFRSEKNTASGLVTFWLHHGQGGGMRAAAPLNKLENLVHAFDADIYLIGHMHKIAAAPIQQLFMADSGRLKFRTKYIAGTGSFLKGYMQESKQGAGRPGGGYVEQKMLTPVALGGIRIRLVPFRNKLEDRVNISVEV